MADKSQNYKNHPRLLPPFHLFVLPVLLVNALNAIRHLWLDPTRSMAFALLVALALLTFAVMARNMALTVQNRVVRLEMRLRLRECLPPDLGATISELTTSQLIALRFASDAEMADLVREVLAGRLASQKEIKMRVKNWQSDFLRA